MSKRCIFLQFLNTPLATDSDRERDKARSLEKSILNPLWEKERESSVILPLDFSSSSSEI